MKILTSRFGEQEIEGSKIIEIADGLVGFSEERYILLHPDNGPFCWLQAVNNPGLAFVVVDPTNFVPDYKVKLTQDEYDKLKIDASDEVVLLSVVTMSRDPKQITMNLQGPIVINPSRMIAKQVVLETVQAATRHPLFTTPRLAPDFASQSVVSLVSSLFQNIGLTMAAA